MRRALCVCLLGLVFSPKLVGYRHRLAFRGAIVPTLPNQQAAHVHL